MGSGVWRVESFTRVGSLLGTPLGNLLGNLLGSRWDTRWVIRGLCSGSTTTWLPAAICSVSASCGDPLLCLGYL